MKKKFFKINPLKMFNINHITFRTTGLTVLCLLNSCCGLTLTFIEYEITNE